MFLYFTFFSVFARIFQSEICLGSICRSRSLSNMNWIYCDLWNNCMKSSLSILVSALPRTKHHSAHRFNPSAPKMTFYATAVPAWWYRAEFINSNSSLSYTVWIRYSYTRIFNEIISRVNNLRWLWDGIS